MRLKTIRNGQTRSGLFFCRGDLLIGSVFLLGRGTEFQTASAHAVITTFRYFHTLRHSRESGNLESLKLQPTFEYCRYPKVWIPAYAGMTVGDDAV